jgi:TonB family protein
MAQPLPWQHPGGGGVVVLRTVRERRSPASLALAILVHAAVGGIVIGGAMMAKPALSPQKPDTPVWLTAPWLPRAPRPPGHRVDQAIRVASLPRAPTPVVQAPPPELVPTAIPVEPAPVSEPTSAGGPRTGGEGAPAPGLDGTGGGGPPGGDPNAPDGIGNPDAPGGPPPSEPVRLKSDMTPPRIRHRVEPELSLMASRMGLRNVEVVVECVIREDGTVAVQRVMKSNPVVDDAVIAAVSQWTYDPALWNGRPQAVFQIVRVKVN